MPRGFPLKLNGRNKKIEERSRNNLKVKTEFIFVAKRL